jgi:hypothetical protein
MIIVGVVYIIFVLLFILLFLFPPFSFLCFGIPLASILLRFCPSGDKGFDPSLVAV